MHRRRWLLILVLLCVTVVGFVVVERLTSSEGRRVGIVGDSITAGNVQHLEKVIGPRFKLMVVARNGLRTEEMIGPAQSIAGVNFDQVIINLGSNDVAKKVPVDQAAANLRRLVAIFTGARCIHLVNINAQMTFFGAKPEETAALHAQVIALNDQIKTIAKDTKRVSIIDWNAIVAKKGTGITFDSVHPTPAGEALLAEAYSDALHGCRRQFL